MFWKKTKATKKKKKKTQNILSIIAIVDIMSINVNGSHKHLKVTPRKCAAHINKSSPLFIELLLYKCTESSVIKCYLLSFTCMFLGENHLGST